LCINGMVMAARESNTVCVGLAAAKISARADQIVDQLKRTEEGGQSGEE
jgi:hypothetical protein